MADTINENNPIQLAEVTCVAKAPGNTKALTGLKVTALNPGSVPVIKISSSQDDSSIDKSVYRKAQNAQKKKERQERIAARKQKRTERKSKIASIDKSGVGSMGLASSNGKYINAATRKALNTMCTVAKVVEIASLVPKPEDFIRKVINDTVNLSCRIMKVTDQLNEMLEVYSNIPIEYLMGTVNNVLDQAVGVVAKLDNAAHTVTDVTRDITNTSVGLVNEVVNDAMYAAEDVSNGIVNLSMSLAQGSTLVAGQVETAADISSAAEVVTSTVSEGVGMAVGKVNNAIGGAMDKTNEGLDKADESIDKVTQKTLDGIAKAQQSVQKAIQYLKDSMDKLEKIIDDDFGVNTAKEKAQNFTSGAAEAIAGANVGVTGDLTNEVLGTANDVIQNFSIGKIVKASIGFGAQCTIVSLGLDQLPKINFEQMLDWAVGEIAVLAAEGYMRKQVANGNVIIADDDFVIQKPAAYDAIYQEMSPYLEEQRRIIVENRRKWMTPETKNAIESDEDKENRKSIAKEVRKRQAKVKAAKQAETMKYKVIQEINSIKEDCEHFKDEIETEWNEMTDQYTEAYNEIKRFFTEGEGMSFVDECCDKIEEDIDMIKETCTGISTKAINEVIAIPMPTSIGPVFDNPGYKICTFFIEMKTIFRYIKDIIMYGIDIIKQVIAIAKIMLNGLNSLSEIFRQLMELLGLKKFMDMIQAIIEFFNGKCLSGKELLENMITPLYYSDTEDYETELANLESRADEKGVDEDKLAEEMDKLEEKGDRIVAYTSPILNETGTELKGYIYYHPDVSHLSYYASSINEKTGKFKIIKTRIKSKYIQRAAKTGGKKNGGKNMLMYKKKLHSGAGGYSNVMGDEKYKRSAYNGFYWYTKWTTDPSDYSDFDYKRNVNDNSDTVSKSIVTENGVLVTLEDGRRVLVKDAYNIQSGDYIKVDGNSYKVK